MRRLAPILRVLARHGFGHLVDRMHLHGLLPSSLRVRVTRTGAGLAGRVSAPKRLVMVLEDLGPTFVKLGQMLATRADLLPEAYISELRALTEHVTPFDTAVARRIVETELAQPISDRFEEFGEAPVAAGSIGQVYHATLRGGEKVVVKVKRPDVEKIMLADLDLLELAARQAERIEEIRPFRPVMLVDEFRRSVQRELDFVAEASVTAKIKEDLSGRVRVPAVLWGMTTSNVLTMERLEGVSLNRREELAAFDVDRKQLARDLAEVFLHQFFKTGLFHADPHPGNILVTPDGRIGLVDFGMSGRLDGELRDYLVASFIALSRRDLDVITDVYMEIGAIPDDVELGRLKAELHEILDKYYGIPLRCFDYSRCLGDFMRVARAHGVLLPRDLVLLGKSFVTMMTVAREIDPDFDLTSLVKPYAISLAADRLSPARLAHDAVVQLWQVSQTVRRLPRDFRTLTRKLLSGKLQLTMNFRGFDRLAKELDRATNRLAFSVIVGAIVIGSGVLLHAGVPPHMEILLPGAVGRFFETYLPHISAIGLAGFLFAGILGILLAVAIWRSGRL